MEQINVWRNTIPGLIVFAVLELAISYGFVSLAIDRGNLWWYLLTFMFLFFFLRNLVLLIQKGMHRAKH